MDKLKYYRVIDLIDEDIVKEAEIRAENPTDTESGGITVSGVERYRRIIWHRLAAVASAVLLIAGIGAGGALMLKRRPPLLEENSETTADSTAEAPDIKASGNSMENSSTEVIGENAEVTSAGKAAATETDTKESKNNTTAEKDKKSAVRDHCYPEDSTESPREENNEPEERENVTTAANTTQLPVLRYTVTKAHTTQKSTTVTTKETVPVTTKELSPPTDNKTPMNYLEYEISKGDDYNTRYKERGYYCDVINGKYQYTICSGERSTGGYGIRITGVNVLDFGTVIVTVEETAPAPDAVVTCALTYPNCIITFPQELSEGIIIKSTSGAEFNYLGNT